MTTTHSDEISIRKVEASDIDGIALLCSQLGYPRTSEEIIGKVNELMNDDDRSCELE